MSVSPAQSLPDISQVGGSDTGGENGIGCSNNKTCGPLESFQMDIFNREEFKTFIDPIIQNTSSKVAAGMFNPIVGKRFTTAHNAATTESLKTKEKPGENANHN